MVDFEKLGVFYLGRPYDLTTKSAKPGLFLYDSKDLVTHAVCLGMTGSGKTGLCIGLLEEAAIDNIPAIIIDPKGDMANLLLTFPELRGSDFLPWVNVEDATRKGMTPEEFAEKEAAKWKGGLESWGQNGDRIARLKQAAECLVFTPGSTAGLPVSILQSFAAPPAAVIDDPELLGERVNTTTTSLLSLVGIDADPLQSREHILLSNILGTAWKQRQDLSLPQLIQQIQSPPFTKVGVMDLESVFSSKERFGLAMRVNNLLGAPGFSVWLEGYPLDITRILHTPSGKPRLAIFSLAHLNDAERMFVVSLLLTQIISWMRNQSGTTSLRALLYMDEVFGFFPPVQNPPSKAPMLTLLKQARAFGLGVVLATQNPVDLDYKGLGNTGTWFIGRLQTERDMARVMEGLEGAAANLQGTFDRHQMMRLISGLGNRIFLVNNVHEDRPEIFETRWALSYLRGPLTRTQIKTLMDPVKASSPDFGTAPGAMDVVTTTSPLPAGDYSDAGAHPPVLPPDIHQCFLPIRGRRPEGANLLYEPRLFGSATIHFLDSKKKIEETRELSVLVPITNNAIPLEWDGAILTDIPAGDLNSRSVGNAAFAELPAPASQPKNYRTWEKDVADWIYRNHKLEIWKSPSLDINSKAEETERDFRVRLQQLAHEERDLETEKLRKKYALKVAALEDRIRRAHQALERETEQAKQHKLQTAISFGATLLSAFLGRKPVTGTSMGKATTAVRGLGRSMKENQDVDRANENMEALKQQLTGLEAEFQKEADMLTSRWNIQEEALQTIAVRPKKSDITINLVRLAWAPFWIDSQAQRTPAWE